jgi:RNA processing factor Prp31
MGFLFCFVNLGMDISPIDLINIESFANRVIHLFEYRKSLQEVKKLLFVLMN